MGSKWTREQQQVIDTRDCNMLVSAAAGSGKTAVLVERIIAMIMDETRPVDIDRLLVVTFTNAAAAEMRERILAALEMRLEENPENAHLQKQVTLIHHAQITTIHSFCLEVIHNHFQAIGLDPGFRIGDEGELKLLWQEVLEKLLEEEYQKNEEDYLYFSECFAPGKTDQELEAVILQLYHFSTGYPWPDKWMEQCGRVYEIRTQEEMNQSEWMQQLLKLLSLQIGDMETKIDLALALTMDPDGPSFYAEALEKDKQKLGQLKQCGDYESYAKALADGESWAALSRKKDPSASEEKKMLVKELRDQVKKGLKKIREDYFFAEPEQMLEDIQNSGRLIKELLYLTKRFTELYSEKKAEKNLVDFNDLEHFALQILVRDTEEGLQVTETAREYARHYAEIMIDEYQDSNLVQEILLQSVSRTHQGGQNTFLVGDVKQSIYRFRLARPELFMEKYHTYTLEEGKNRRIDLHKNFRSRKEVLDGVNLIFYQIMTGLLGGIEYDEEAALYAGAEFEPREPEDAF
ncbi:MAG: UvrD-helicase domain-containing protein, partial [Lachnospiraceae bacterium]|nr:UvrD-helicase domain-containing protein [Lachnospiraceae bacterium]